MLADVLALTAALPERSLAAGETLYVEGDTSVAVAVLVDGELVIETDGFEMNRMSTPGSFVGETGALLGQPRSATVRSTTDSVIREIGDPDDFFAAHPQLGLEVARQLAGRLHRLTAYVSDVQRQFGGRDDHLGVFAELLTRLSVRPAVDLEPGSDRSPDY